MISCKTDHIMMKHAFRTGERSAHLSLEPRTNQRGVMEAGFAKLDLEFEIEGNGFSTFHYGPGHVSKMGIAVEV